MPDEVAFIYAAFQEMQRPYSNGIPLAMSNQEIMAWCWLNRLRLRPDELHLLRVIDGCWRRSVMKGVPNG